MKISRNEAVEILENLTSPFFSVVFIKRTTGEKRKMLCRKGVKKHLKGGTLSFNPKEKQLLIVYDAEKQGYRSIPLDAVLEIRVNGKTYKVGA